MFQSTGKRLRALLRRFDDALGDPTAQAPHPHRRPVRIDFERRGGSVAPRPARCLCPVRPVPERERRELLQ